MAELKERLDSSEKILVGAGAGLSAAAGLSYLDEDLFKKFQPEMAARGYHYPYELFQHENDGWPQHGNGLTCQTYPFCPLCISCGRAVQKLLKIAGRGISSLSPKL